MLVEQNTTPGQESRRQRLLKSARLPTLKSLTGFDYTSVKFPADYGREALTSLESSTMPKTWSSTEMSAPAKPTSPQPWPQPPANKASRPSSSPQHPWSCRLRRAKDEGRLDKELASIAKNKLLIIDLCRGGNYAELL